MITKFGKRFLTSHLAGLVDFTTKDLALGIGSSAVNQFGNDTRLEFEFYRLPATLSSIDIRSADITGLSSTGSAVTYTAQNNFSPGQTVKITGVVPTQYNVSSAVVTSASNSQFTIASSSTGNYTSGGYASSYSAIFSATIPQDISGVISEIGLYPGLKSSINNYDSKFIADFENNLMWFKSDGANPELAATTTSGIIPRVGSYFSKVGVSPSQSMEFVCSYSGLDLSGYTASDSLSLAYNQENTNLDSIVFRFYSSDSSYYSATFAGAASVTDTNKIAKVLFSSLVANNAYADLTSIIKIGVVITAKSSGQAVVYLDALRIDDEDTFDANFGLISRSVVSPIEKIAGKPVDIEYRINLGF